MKFTKKMILEVCRLTYDPQANEDLEDSRSELSELKDVQLFVDTSQVVSGVIEVLVEGIKY